MSEATDPTMTMKNAAAAVDASVGWVGGRSPSTLSTGQAATRAEQPEVLRLGPGQRWSLARKKAVVMRMLRGEPIELLSRELGCRCTSSSAGATRRRGRSRGR